MFGHIYILKTKKETKGLFKQTVCRHRQGSSHEATVFTLKTLPLIVAVFNDIEVHVLKQVQ